MAAKESDPKNANSFGFSRKKWHIVLFIQIFSCCLFIFISVYHYIRDKTIRENPWYAILSFILIWGLLWGHGTFLLWRGIFTRSAKLLRLYGTILRFFAFPFLIFWLSFILWRRCAYATSWLACGFGIGAVFLNASFVVWYVFFMVSPLTKKLGKDAVAMSEISKAIAVMGIERASASEYVEFESNSQDNLLALSKEGIKKNLIDPIFLQFDKSRKLGEGQFGVVYRGKYVTANGEEVEVAGKAGKFSQPLQSVAHEIHLSMRVGRHPNILEFFGVSFDVETETFLLISEFCEIGPLDNYLQKLKPTYDGHVETIKRFNDRPYSNVTLSHFLGEIKKLTKDLCQFAKSICSGMMYLVEKKIVHGDLAARNVLLTSNRQVKLSDFGMSNKLYNYQLYVRSLRHDVLPWRWLPVETLEDLVFSEKSDVYSFGVLLWELFSLGEIPFHQTKWSPDIIKLLWDGTLRLNTPKFGDDKLYHIIKTCCNNDKSLRPNFTEVNELLQNIMNIRVCINE